MCCHLCILPTHPSAHTSLITPMRCHTSLSSCNTSDSRLSTWGRCYSRLFLWLNHRTRWAWTEYWSCLSSAEWTFISIRCTRPPTRRIIFCAKMLKKKKRKIKVHLSTVKPQNMYCFLTVDVLVGDCWCKKIKNKSSESIKTRIQTLLISCLCRQ